MEGIKKQQNRKKKSILVISQYFYPEQFRVNDLCKEWVKRGYKVTVLTGIPNYPEGKFYKGYGLFKKRCEKHEGIQIIRLPLIPRGNRAVMLALNYLSFVVSGVFWEIFTKIKSDYVFVYEVSPMTQALPGVWYAKKRRIPCYLYVTDLWPENVEIITGVRNRFFIGPIGKMVDYIYKRCDMIFTSSRSFVDAIKARGVEEEKLEFWPQYAEDFYQRVVSNEVQEELIPQDKTLNIIFAGNIGYAQGLEILPEAARLIKERGLRVRFNIIGDGRYKEELVNLVSEKDVVDMFYFISKQSPEKISHFMAQGDVALISLAKSKVFSITIPAKTQSCLACGIPILVSGDGEIQSIIKEAKAGLCSDASDVNGLARNIEKFCNLTEVALRQMGDNGKRYSEQNFNKEVLLKRMDEYFSNSHVIHEKR